MSAKMGRPRLENPNSVRTSVRLDVNTDKQLSDYCKKNGISKGEAVREAVQQWLEHQK